MAEDTKFRDSTIEKEYMTLTEVLKLLPGVMPNKARKVIARACLNYYEYCECYKDGNDIDESAYNEHMLKIGSSKINPEERDEIWIEAFYTFHTMNGLGDGCTIRVSPAGAEIVLKLYLNGDLPLRKNAAVSDSKILSKYIARRGEFESRLEKSRVQKERQEFLLTHPEDVKEADFTFSFLNALFLRQKGSCKLEGQMMVLDGIEVYKSLSVYSSNSGKSRDFEVTISWTGTDGIKHNVSNTSMYSGNRRNDSDRNWGLPK